LNKDVAVSKAQLAGIESVDMSAVPPEPTEDFLKLKEKHELTENETKPQRNKKTK
jgi:hypothetical protein